MQNILSYFGLMLEINAFLVFIHSLIALSMGERFDLFLLSSTLSFIFGIFLEKRFKRKDITLMEAMIIAVLCFLIIPLFNSLIYVSYSNIFDAYFESVSGITTTGLTVLDTTNIGISILLWRSFTQWIGGFGILLIFVLITTNSGRYAFYMFKAEGKERRTDKNVYNTVKAITKIYILFTIIAFLLYVISGISIENSIMLSLTSISTGGFVPNNLNFSTLPVSTKIATIFVMFLGAISFFVHDSFLKKKFKTYLSNIEVKYMFLITTIFFLILLPINVSETTINIIFLIVSAITTTGYNSFQTMGDITKMFIIFLMIMGGCSNSTSGGLKIIRFVSLIKSFLWFSKKSSLPRSAVIPLKVGDKLMKEQDIAIISMFSLLYIIILTFSASIIAYTGNGIVDSFFLSASAQGTVGLSTINISKMPLYIKFILIIQMVIGRLEIIPFLVFLRSLILRRF